MRSLLHPNGLPQEKPDWNESGHITAWRQEFLVLEFLMAGGASLLMLLQKAVLKKPSTTLGELENSGLLHRRAQRS